MRTLFLLRGAPGAGKSTWVRENGLEPYTLCADTIRQMIAGLDYNMEGEAVIPQSHDTAVWKLLFKLLEDRMARGEFIVVDATHYRAAMLQAYKKLISRYRYRPYVIDFTEVPEDLALARNRMREGYKFVPPKVIDKMYTVFRSDFKEVSNKFTILKPQEAVELLHKSLLFDYNEYEKIVVFGDIHGCYVPIENYFKDHPMNDKTAYIFTGDYLDRGIQNKEVIEFLLSIYERKNVLLLEGNHEQWLRMYAHDEHKPDISKEDKEVLLKYLDKSFFNEYRRNQIRNKGFLEKTAPQLAGFRKSDLRVLCRRIGQMAYISFRGKNYFITHGGCPMLPSLFVPTWQYIEGVGKYEEVDALYENWVNNTDDTEILVHAHRNVFQYPAKMHDRCYNLCGDVENGEELRIMEITEQGISILLYENPVYDEERVKERKEKNAVNVNVPPTDLMEQLESTNLVEKKRFENGICSYNFTRKAFDNAIWNFLTCTARGLFVKDNVVVARSYNKFFNWGERDAVTSRSLQERFVFPVTAYRKENGFLAMVSNFEGKLLVCSKSTIKGPYVEFIKEALKRLGKDVQNKILKYSEEHNCTFVFECVDPKNDPHIISYANPHLYLLDIVKNDFQFQCLPFDELRSVAYDIGLEHKKKAFVFNSWSELYKFYKDTEQMLDPYEFPFVEGYVLVDANGFMVKYKTPNYRWWKGVRSIMERLQANHTVKPVYKDTADIKIFALLNRLKDEGKLDLMNVLDVQNEFWQK